MNPNNQPGGVSPGSSTPSSPSLPLKAVAAPRPAPLPTNPAGARSRTAPGGRGGGKVFRKVGSSPLARATVLPQGVVLPQLPPVPPPTPEGAASPPATLPPPPMPLPRAPTTLVAKDREPPTPALRPTPAARPASRRDSQRMSPVIALGGLLVAVYPVSWRSQGGLAAELAAVLDQVREKNTSKPSLLKVNNLVQAHDLGTELARFQMRLDEVFNGVASDLPRDLLKGLFDALGESAWWLLQAYSREELRSTEVPKLNPKLLGMDTIRNLENPQTDSELELGDAPADGAASAQDRDTSLDSLLSPRRGTVGEGDDPIKALAKSKKVYMTSTNVLASLEERLMVHITAMKESLATTADSEHWAQLACSGPKSLSTLLRELELGANDPTTRDLGSRLFQAVEAVFDQYTGMRQINDFRGLPDAPFLLPDANQLIQRIYERTLAVGLQTLENLELVEEDRLASAFEAMCDSLLKEYKAFKAGLLTKLGYLSSLREKDRGRNLNSTIVLEYIRQVMVICDEAVEEATTAFNDRVQQIDLLNPTKQKEIYSSMGGRQELGQRVRNHLFQIKPWARESIQLQTESLLQREVFGKSRADILTTLNASKDQMLAGFRALTEGKIPEPLNRLDELIIHLDSCIEAVLGPANARKTTSRFGNKKVPSAGKASSRGRRAARGTANIGDGPSLAITGATIRGNKFTEADMEEFALEAGTTASVKK